MVDAKPRRTLAPRQEVLAREYVATGNLTEAARRAGYSESTALRTVHHWTGKNPKRQKPALIARIAELQAKKAAKIDVSADKVLRELCAIAFADICDVIQIEDGHVTVTDTAALTPAQRAALGTIKETRAGIEIKMADKIAALDRLGKHLGLFREQVDVTLTGLEGMTTDELRAWRAELAEREARKA
jgi:phage terminase small subunit